MKVKLATSFLIAIAVTACGSDSGENPSKVTGSTEKPAPSETKIPVQPAINPSLKGPEKEPNLTQLAVKEGDNVKINSLLSGNVLEDSSVKFVFTPEKNQKIAIALSSNEASDLDLQIDADEYNLPLYSPSSTELAVLDVLKGIPYTIEVKSISGFGKFQLKLAEANRKTLGLSSNEYFYAGVGTDTYTCIQNNGTLDEKKTIIAREQIIVNWKEKYFTYGGDKRPFTSIDSNVAIISYSYSKEKPTRVLTAQSKLTLSQSSKELKVVEKYKVKNKNNLGGCDGDWVINTNIQL